MTIRNSWKRVIAASLAMLVVAVTVPANFGQVKLFDTAITASAVEVSETITANQGGKDYTSTHFKISGTDGDGDGLAVGLLHDSTHTVTVSSLNGETIKKIEATVGYMEHNGSLAVNPGSLSGFTYVNRGGCDISVTDVNATSVTFTQPATDWGALVQIKTIKIYYDGTDVSGINLNKTSTTLTIGDSETLQATVLPDDAYYKTVTWSSDNEEVATVDENGNVTAVKAGTATITATATNGTDDTTDDDVSAVLTVTVNKADSTVTTAPTANELTYTGKGQDLVTKGETEDGTIVYALGESADTAPNDDAFFENIPGGTEAGDYYVWYKVLGDENHNDSEPASVKVTIAEPEDSSETDSSTPDSSESTPESSEAESTADDSSAADSKADSKSDTSKAADSSSKAAAAATTSNPATGAAAAGVGALALAAAALIVAKKKDE